MATLSRNKSGSWKIRFFESSGKRISKTFKTREEADVFKMEIELRELKYGRKSIEYPRLMVEQSLKPA